MVLHQTNYETMLNVNQLLGIIAESAPLTVGDLVTLESDQYHGLVFRYIYVVTETLSDSRVMVAVVDIDAKAPIMARENSLLKYNNGLTEAIRRNKVVAEDIRRTSTQIK
ncbi:MAG: hypothetical protein GY938_13180 [Ketobacter sp.]|nr:hypothetical protein [Ketobacter sp.]